MFILIQILIIIILFFLSAYFSGTETALMSLPRMRIKKMVNDFPKKAKALKVWLEHPNKYLTTILVGNNAVNVMISVIATSIVISICIIYQMNEVFFVSATAVLVWTLLLIFGEVSPKTFAIRNAEKIVKFNIVYLHYFDKFISPVSKIFIFIGSFIVGTSGKKEIPILTHEDVKTTISVGHEMGVFGIETKQMMHSVLKFPQITAKSIMTPREKMAIVNIDTEKEKFIDLIVETGHSRVPVYKDTAENIIGIIYARDLLDMLRAGEVFTIDDLLRPVFFVEETKKINELMRQFKKGESHVAVVKDAESKVIGLITIEDIIEEVFGEILDEYDVEELFKE